MTIICLLSVHFISFSNNKLISILWRNDCLSMPLLLIPNLTKTKTLLWSCAKSLQSCPTLHDSMDCSLPDSLVHGDPPGKNTGMDCHALLQGIFANQGSNPCLCYLLAPASGFFTTSTTGAVYWWDEFRNGICCSWCSVATFVRIFATPRTAACHFPLSFTISQSLLRFMSIESVMPSNHLILSHPLLLLPSIFPSIRVFSNELALCMSWPKY